MSVTSVCCGGEKAKGKEEIGPHTRTTGQQDKCERNMRNEDPGGVVQPSSVLNGTVEEKEESTHQADVENTGRSQVESGSRMREARRGVLDQSGDELHN